MSKKEKKGAATPVVAPPQNLPPGFTVESWKSMVAVKDGQQYALEIVDYILSNVYHEIQELEIDRRVKQYAVSRAKETMMGMVELCYLARDEGNHKPEFDTTWLPDKEPEAPPIDTWARGCIPVREPRVSSWPGDIRVTVATPKSKRRMMKNRRSEQAGEVLINKSAEAVNSAPVQPPSQEIDTMKATVTEDLVTGSVTTHDKNDPTAERKSNTGTQPKPPRRASPGKGHQRSRAGKRSVAPPRSMPACDPQKQQHQNGSPVEMAVQHQFDLEVAAIQTARQAGAQEFSYVRGGVVPIIGVDSRKLPRHRVLPKVSVAKTSTATTTSTVDKNPKNSRGPRPPAGTPKGSASRKKTVRVPNNGTYPVSRGSQFSKLKPVPPINNGSQ